MRIRNGKGMKYAYSVALTAAFLSTGLAVSVQAASQGGTDTGEAGPVFHMRGYVSTTPSPVRLAGEDVFTIKSAAGGFSAEERSLIIERNLNNALVACKDRGPAAVDIITINHLPVIRLGGKHVLTIDSNLARANGMALSDLAYEWAGNMRKALTDNVRVENYVSQLSGDYLTSPYSPPFRRAQWQAARLNHAAPEVRPALPPNLISSASIRDEGFGAMLKRDPVAAESYFVKALRLEPENERARYGLGTALLKEGRVDAAIAELTMARWLDPDDAQVHLALGQALESKGLDGDAYERYREAQLLHPEDPAPALFIADMRESRDDIGRSAVELTEASKNCPQSEYLRLRLKDQVAWRLTKTY